ncbi:MAG: site-specific DNA-methyltransferase [Erysipelotrichaceae bacterium]
MIKNKIVNNDLITPNMKEIVILKEYFPSCFKNDGSFDINKFSEFLKDKVDIIHEGYELKFLGKSYAKLLSSLDTETVIVPDEVHNSKVENINSENVYISGDNLDGLKHLLKSYAGQVKCIYIDPPYNTGSDGFVYNDKFDFTVDDLVTKLSIDEDQAQRIMDLTKRGSASHSAWLMFMYPRLLLARDLLKDDGVIFISIDDNEQSNLKLLCDEVFGEENSLTCISRATGTPTGGGFDGFVNEMDYILVYSKNVDAAIIQGITMSESDAEIYTEIDANGNKYLTRTLRRTGGEDRREDRPTMFYPLIAPDGTEVFPYGPTGYESRWRCSLAGAKALEENGLLAWKQIEKDGVLLWHPYKKFYLNDTKKPGNIWKDINEDYDGNLGLNLWDNIEGNKKATRDIRDLFDNKKVFETAKPIELIEKIISLGSDEEDIIIDFFGGSSTTAHAIMRTNNRIVKQKKYILIQLPEPVKLKSEAEKAGYKTIDQIGMERIIRAAKKIKEENPETTIDLGFKHYTLQEVSKNTLDKLEKFDPSIMFVDDTIYNMFGANTILTTWLVHDGYGFSNNMQSIIIGEYIAYWCENHLYLINPHFNENTIKALIEKYNSDGAFNPQNVVVFGYSFDFVNMESLKVNLKILKDSEKNLKINLDIRY